MNKLFFSLLAIFVFQLGNAQEPANNENRIVYNTATVEFAPEFPGGMSSFYQFIGDNFKSPSAVDFLGGKVFVSFVIEKDGSVVDIKVMKHVGFDTDKETIRVLELCPKWKPAQQFGKNVRCMYSLPIVLMPHVFEPNEVDVKPNYEGGFQGISKIIMDRFKKPTDKEFKGGDIQMTFTVEIDGSLSNIQIYKNIGFGAGEESVRVLKEIRNWIPAIKDGKKVRCYFGLPIKLNGN
jgi:hypothetical protein